MAAKVGRFTAITSSGPTQAVTGVGFTPKMVFLMCGVSTTENSLVANARGMWGVAGGTGSTEQITVGLYEDDNVDPSNAAVRIQEALLTVMTDGSGTEDGRCTLDSFDSDGFTVNWSNLCSSAFPIYYLAIGGDDITDVHCGSLTVNTSTGNQSITAPGFQPDFIFFIGTSNTAFGLNSSGDESSAGVGCAVSSTARWSIRHSAEDNETMMANRFREFNIDECFECGDNSPVGAVNLDFVSMDANGFTVNVVTAPSTGNKVGYVAVKGGSWAVSNYQKTTSAAPATDTVTLPTPTFQPEGIFFGFHMEATTAANAGANISIGVSDGTDDYSVSSVSEQHADPSNASAYLSTSKAMMATPDATHSADALGTVSAINSDGYDITWDPNEANADYVGYFAFATGDETGADVDHFMLLGVG